MNTKKEIENYVKSGTVVGVMSNVLLLLSIAIHYILYKLQLPYEIIVFSLICIWSFYTIYKHLAISALQYQDTFDNEFYLGLVEQLILVGFALGIIIILLSLLIHFSLGGVINNTGVMFTFVLILLAVQQTHFSIKLMHSVSERDKQIGIDMMNLAVEMKENGKFKIWN